MIGEETGEKSCKLPQNLTCQEDCFIFFLKIFHGFKNIHYICTQISDHWLKVVQTPLKMVVPGKKPLWSEKDDELLRTLYKERQCSIEVLVAVFNKVDSEIRQRIKILKLDE